MTGDRALPPRHHSTEAGLFRFCPDCARRLDRREIHGRARPHCPACGFVQWRNPGVGMWFRAVPQGGMPRAGDDADRIGFFHPDRIAVPLAFPTDRVVLTALLSVGP